MFGSLTILVALTVLAMLSAGGIAYFVLYPRIQAERNAGRRLEQLRSHEPVGDKAHARIDAAKRRRSVQETLREIEELQRAKLRQKATPPLSLRLSQAGLTWSRNGFLVFSFVCGVAVALLSLLFGAPLWAAAALGLAGLLGLPRWVVNFLRKRRIKRFLAEFANAMDVIVRGVRAGLPLNDCIRIIASEAAEPVRGEFRQIAESQGLGIPTADAVARLPERVPIPETNFFAIVVNVHQRAGGNLSEALSNLSRVLRERQKMKGKIRAMSMEAKMSALIIGALPFVVMLLVYITSPGYIMLLFTEPFGHIILVASAIWMGIGVFMMRRMVNFDF